MTRPTSYASLPHWLALYASECWLRCRNSLNKICIRKPWLAGSTLKYWMHFCTFLQTHNQSESIVAAMIETARQKKCVHLLCRANVNMVLKNFYLSPMITLFGDFCCWRFAWDGRWLGKQDHRRWRYHRRLLDYQSPYFQLKALQTRWRGQRHALARYN